MSMNIERAALRGRLSELQGNVQAYRNRGKGLASAVRMEMNTNLRPLEELPVAQAAAMMDQLVMVQGELLATLDEIRRIEAELNG